MKRLLIAAAVAGGMLCGAQNLLDNPSFEELNPQTPLAASSWNRHLPEKHPNAYSLDSALAQDGQRSACIEVTDKNELESYTLLIQSGLQDKLTQQCPPGTDMEFSVSVRTSGKDASYRIYAEGSINAEGDTCFITAEKKNTDPSKWERLILPFKMPAKPFKSAYCCLQIQSPGKVWFDSAYLGPAALAPFYASAEAGGNRLANAGMETIGADGVPEHWERLGDRTAHSVAKTAHAGSASLCLSTTTAAPEQLVWKQSGLADLLKDCEPGAAMALSGWINNDANPSVKSRMSIEMLKDGKPIGTYATGEISSYLGWQQFTLRFNMPKEIPDNAAVCLQLLNNGTVYFDDLWLGLDKDAPVQVKVYIEDPSTWCRVTDFPPQQAYYWPDRPTGLALEYALPKDANGRLEVVLRDAASNLPVKTYEITAPGKTTLDLPELGKGTYLLDYTSGKDFKGFDIFRVIEPYTQGVKVLSEGRTLLNGKPFFPLLICTPASGPEAYRVYELAGFNSLCVSGISSPSKLSVSRAAELDKYHLAYVDWCNLGDSYKGESFDKQIAFARTLPNFVGWMDDESEWRSIPIEKMRAFYKVLYTRAPEYIVWQNHAPRLSEPDGELHSFANIRLYSHACDITGCDIYPVPEGGGHSGLPNKSMSCVGEYTDLAMASAYGQKPIWMIIMAGAWSEEGGKPVDPERPRPTYGQFRFQFYNAVTHGARGIVYYSYKGGLHDFYSPFMAMMADVNHEFHAIEDFYNLGQASKVEAAGDTQEVRIDARILDDQHLVIAVNEGKTVREIDLPLPSKLTFYRSPDGAEISAINGRLAVALQANEVLILSTRKVAIPAFKPFVPDPTVTDTLLRKTDWKSAQWTAHPQLAQAPQKTTFARHIVTLSDKPSAAWLQVAVDDACTLKVNGQPTAETAGYSVATRFDVAKYLVKGENTFSFEVANSSGPSGLLYLGSITDGGKEIAVTSGPETLFSADGKADWVKAVQVGPPPCDPWGEVMLLDE